MKIVVVGKPYRPELKQLLAKNYNFQFYFIDCTVTKDLQSGIKDYNKVIDKYLTNKYGNNFWNRFNAQVDSVDKIEVNIKVLDLVKEVKIVIDQIKLIDSLSKGQRHISLIPTLNDTAKNIYLVKVGEDNGMNFVTYYNFLVDANSMTIINTKGKLEGQ